MSAAVLPVHIVIPDLQLKPGVDTSHLDWISRYIWDHYHDRPQVKIIQLGDAWDLPSLSSYDRGKRAMEGRRYMEDVAAGNEGFARLSATLVQENGRRRKNRDRQWWPERILLRGNHEDRIRRAVEENAQIDGLMGIHQLEAPGWRVHDYLEPVDLDGVVYSHVFVNPMTGKPMGGQASTRLKTLGHSFTMGHQQTLDYAVRFVKGRSQHGLVVGSAYLHEEEYLGPQGNAHWRGIVVCFDVDHGSYDPLFISLNYLARKYAGSTLAEYVGSRAA